MLPTSEYVTTHAGSSVLNAVLAGMLGLLAVTMFVVGALVGRHRPARAPGPQSGSRAERGEYARLGTGRHPNRHSVRTSLPVARRSSISAMASPARSRGRTSPSTGES